MTVQQALPENWRKSTYSQANTDCVEIADNADVALIRDTKDRDGGALAVDRASFAAFVSFAKRGH